METLPDIAARSPWLTTAEALAYTKNKSPKTLYTAVASGRLRAARSGARALRFKTTWLDEYLEATAEPVAVRR